MAKLPMDTRLKTEQQIEDKEIVQELRPYLGISGIADECPRKLWYAFRWCGIETINPRKARLFRRGHLEEPIIIADLEKIGIRVHSAQEECTTCNGHVKGHSDGQCDNVPDAPKTTHLLEIKTGNDKNFKGTKKNGLIVQHPVYHGQMICYMRLYKLSRGLFIMANKNDDERYYERVYEDKQKADELFSRALDIISSEVPLPKMAGPTYFKCKWCTFYQICHFQEPVLQNCRTCHFGDICDEGVWECSKYQIQITTEQQRIGCHRYKLLEILA